MKTFLALLLLVGLSGIDCFQVDKTCLACKKHFSFLSNVTHGGVEMKRSLTKLFNDYYDGPNPWTEDSIGKFFDVINRNLDVNTICYDIKACSDESDDGIREFTHFESDENCEFCVFVAKKVKEIISGGPTEIAIKAYLEDACHYTLGLKDECIKMVDVHTDAFFKFIQEKFDPTDFCKCIRLCPRKTGVLRPVLSASRLVGLMPVNMKSPSERTAEVEGPICSLCIIMATTVNSYIINNSTEDVIISALHTLCSCLPFSRENCHDFVDTNAKTLIDKLVDSEAYAACALMDLCIENPKNPNFHQAALLPKTFPVEKSKKSITDECQICEILRTTLQQMIKNKFPDQVMIEALNYVCQTISGQEQICKHEVDAHGKQLIAILKKDIESVTACSEVGLCPQKNKNPYVYQAFKFPKKFPVFEKKSALKDDSVECEICEQLVSLLKQYIKNNSTEQEIIDGLHSLCESLPVDFQKTCNEDVDMYAKPLIDILVENIEAKTACIEIGLCAQKFKSHYYLPATLPKPVSADPISCDLCKEFVNIVEEELKKNSTQVEIIETLTIACNVLPPNERDQCKAAVPRYVTYLIEMVTNSIDAQTACTMLGLCTPSNFEMYLKGYYLAQRRSESNALCVECELIAHYIQNELYKYKNEEQIEEFIEHHLCNRLSLIINKSNCEAFVRQYGPLIIQTIAQEVFDPNTLCFKEIPVCHKKKFQPTKDVSVRHQSEKCQMCQDIVSKMNTLDSINAEIEAIKTKACGRVSKPLQVECGLMVQAFGPYFFEMVHRYENSFELCKSMDLCMVPGHVHLLGAHKCTYGPSYWCHSTSHAEACNALSYCREKFWKPLHMAN